MLMSRLTPLTLSRNGTRTLEDGERWHHEDVNNKKSDLCVYFSRWSTFVLNRGILVTWWRGWLLMDGESVKLRCYLSQVFNPLSLQPSWLPMCWLCSSASQHHQVSTRNTSCHKETGSYPTIIEMFRFRKGVVFAKNDFNTVCSWVQFPNDAAWKYDIMISKIF